MIVEQLHNSTHILNIVKYMSAVLCVYMAVRNIYLGGYDVIYCVGGM